MVLAPPHSGALASPRAGDPRLPPTITGASTKSPSPGQPGGDAAPAPAERMLWGDAVGGCEGAAQPRRRGEGLRGAISALSRGMETETQLHAKPARLVGVVGEETSPQRAATTPPKPELAGGTRSTADPEGQMVPRPNPSPRFFHFSLLFKEAAKNTAPGARRSRAAPGINVSGGATLRSGRARPRHRVAVTLVELGPASLGGDLEDGRVQPQKPPGPEGFSAAPGWNVPSCSSGETGRGSGAPR